MRFDCRDGPSMRNCASGGTRLQRDRWADGRDPRLPADWVRVVLVEAWLFARSITMTMPCGAIETALRSPDACR